MYRHTIPRQLDDLFEHALVPLVHGDESMSPGEVSCGSESGWMTKARKGLYRRASDRGRMAGR